MSDDSMVAVVPDIAHSQKNAISIDTNDLTESTGQPPLKKSASNVPITLNIRYKTKIFSVQCDLYDTLKDLKDKIDLLTDIDPQVQKLVNKSITSVKRDDATTTLKDLKLTDGQTLLLIGATRSEISSASDFKSGVGSKISMDDNASSIQKKEPLCKQAKHEKVIKMGKPDNAQIGIMNRNDPLPPSIEGLYMSILNQTAKKARLTFKLEQDELWINTAGAISGALVSILVSPLDVIKTSIQVKRLPKGVLDTPLLSVMYILGQQEGFRAFYKGLGATMLGYVPNWAVYFTAYQWCKKQIAFRLSSSPFENDVLINLLASITAGAVSNIVIAPMWTIRTRMMTQSNREHYQSSFDAARKIYKTEGLYALYRGVIPSMIGLVHVGIQFPLYEHLKKQFTKNHSSSNEHLSIHQLMIASSISKLIASCTAYPHEIVRSRLQDAGYSRRVHSQYSTEETSFREYRNVRDAVRTIAREEGVRGFYRGILPNLIRTVPSAVLTLLSYEKMKELLTDNFGANSEAL